MPFIFAKWATAHALNLMGPMGLCFPYFYGKMGIVHALYLMAQIFLFFCHPMDLFNTDSNVLTAIHVDCIPAGCSSNHEAACIRGRKSLTSAHRLPASPASKASLVTSSRCEQRLNGAGCSPKNGTSMRLKIGAGMALQWRWLQPQKWQLNSARYGVWSASKMAPETESLVRLKMTP